MITELDKLTLDDCAFINADCMEGLKRLPDKCISLAVVDPPYGSGGGEWSNGERFGQRFDKYRKSGGAISTRTEKERQTTRRNVGLSELAADGRTNTTRQKNYCVGHSAGERILCRTFPCLTKSDNMGRQLL